MKLPLRYEDECHYDKAGTVIAKFWQLIDADGAFIATVPSEKNARELVALVNEAVEQDLASQG